MQSEPSAVPPPRRGSCLMVIIGLSLLSVVVPALLLLPTGPIGPFILFGGLGCGFLFAFHYFVWGRWLTHVLRDEDRGDESSAGDSPP